jgi:probable rRNA maturation factor
MSPSIAVHNRQRAIKIDIVRLQGFAERALELALKSRARKIRPQKLSHIDVILVSDRLMTELHRRFLQIAGPTDVITFQHGEIFISVETARRQASAYRTSLKDELQLYVIHGLLHLRGFDDKSASRGRVMRVRQDRILREASKERRLPSRRPNMGALESAPP